MEVALAGHREFVLNLHARGHLVAAGPTPDRPDTAQTVLRGFDDDGLREALAGAPAVAVGRVVVDVTPCLVVLTEHDVVG